MCVCVCVCVCDLCTRRLCSAAVLEEELGEGFEAQGAAAARPITRTVAVAAGRDGIVGRAQRSAVLRQPRGELSARGGALACLRHAQEQ